MIEAEQLLEAIDRIARTPDGELLYLYLQRTLMGVLTGPNIEPGALSADNGRRSFAAELMARMAKGMSDSAGRTESSTASRASERAVVFAPRQSANVSGRQSAREFISATDPELAAAGRTPGSSG